LIPEPENMKVMVVDDNPDNVELVVQILSDFYKTLSADSGAKCIELAKEQQPDLILLDVMMPQMDGYAVLKALQTEEKTKDIPVIFLTARYKDIDRIVKGLQLGAFDYITKPFDDEILLARAGVALRVKYAEDQLRLQKILLEKQVDDLARAQAEIRSAYTELNVKNKELESFSYSVSHDLRAPLRAISGYSEVLLEECHSLLDKSGKEHLQRICHNVKQMDSLISDLIKLARTSNTELNVQQINLSDLVKKFAERIQQNSEKHSLNIQVQPNVFGSADLSLMRLVFENLLDNALKYTSKVKEPVIEFGELNTKDGNTYFVKDNGVGFDQRHSDKLFKVFQRLHNADEYPGSGIGLATVERIVLRHGGKVWGESSPENGTTFYFTLSENG